MPAPALSGLGVLGFVRALELVGAGVAGPSGTAPRSASPLVFGFSRNGTGGAGVARFTTGVGRVRRSLESSSSEKVWDRKRGRAQLAGIAAVVAPMGGVNGRIVGAERSSPSSKM